MRGRSFEFPVNDWIEATNGVKAQRQFTLSPNGFHDVAIETLPKPRLSELSMFFFFSGKGMKQIKLVRRWKLGIGRKRSVEFNIIP